MVVLNRSWEEKFSVCCVFVVLISLVVDVLCYVRDVECVGEVAIAVMVCCQVCCFCTNCSKVLYISTVRAAE